MRDFIRLQLKLKWGLNRDNSKASAVMTAVAAFLAVAIALLLVLALSYALKNSVGVSAKRLAVLYLTVIMAGLTVSATGMQMKRLYRPADLLITARFPLSPFKLFASYLVLNYIDLTIYAAVLFVPVMIVLGIAMECFSFVFVLGILLGVLLLPVIPFGLSVFLAIPLVYLFSFLEKHNTVLIAAFVLFLVGAFFLYDHLLTVLAQFFIHGNWQTDTLRIWEGLLAGLDSYYNPACYLGNAVFFERFWLGFGGILGAGAALIAGGVALSRIVCDRLRTDALDGGGFRYGRKTQIDGFGDARAIFRYQFKEILRTKTYSYFYLGVAISTPVMVFFCNRLVQWVGEAAIGTGVNFGASMIVVGAFMAMICSFTGTILSAEGKNFYLTKLVPVSYRKQLCIKGLLNIAVSAVALLISTAVLGALRFLNAAEMSVLVVTQLLFAVGLVCNGINLNLANPNLKPKASGEPEEINIAYMLLIGFAVAALTGACSLILPRVMENGETAAYLIAVAVAFVYAAVNMSVFWFTAEKQYRKIEA